MCIFKFCIQLFGAHHVQVHHVANIEVEDPVLRVFDPKGVPDVELKPLVLNEVE